MTAHPDWLPYQCLHCGTHRDGDAEAHVECGSDEMGACDCGSRCHSGSYVCPVCGHGWKGLPPDDWDGISLTRTEKRFQKPPQNHYGREHLGFRRSKWGRLGANDPPDDIPPAPQKD